MSLPFFMLLSSINVSTFSALCINLGSVMECLYALQSFGIPSNQMPLVNGITSNKKRRRKNKTKKNDSIVGEDTNSSNLDLKNHTRFLQLCQLKESNIKLCGKEWKYYNGYDQQQIIECPKHSDILSGRGMGTMHHPGNAVFRNIVTSKLEAYVELKSNEEKIKFTLDVVHLLKNQYGARFLKEEMIESNGKLGCWIEVPDEAARIKVRISFRDKIKQQQWEQQQNEMMHPMITMSATDDNINNNNTSNNKNDTGASASASNNVFKQKNEMQEKQKQLTSLTTAPIIDPSINFRSSTALSMLSRTASLIFEREKQVEEGTDSNASLFLNQNGSANRCVGGGCCSSCNSTGKKRQL